MIFKTASINLLHYIWDRIPSSEHDAFHLWACGKENFMLVEFVPLWNKNHGGAFFINEDRDELQALDAILKLWEGK